MTVLVADSGYATTFLDGPSPDGTEMTFNLSPADGAVCWVGLDCVSWGSFSGTVSPGSPAASPGGITAGTALRRTISPGCATLLEASDDRDNSALDLSPVLPSPRANSTAPSERACDSSGPQAGGPGGQGEPGAPQTTLKRKPPKKTRDRTPTFRFASDEPASTFQCKLDRKPFRSCRSPFTAKTLALGRHIFKTRARDTSGQLDLTAATWTFKIVATGG